MSCHLVNSLPIHLELLTPAFITSEMSQNILKLTLYRKILQYFKAASRIFLQCFQLDTKLKRNGTSEIILYKTSVPNSCRIQSENGQFYRRNTIHIEKCSENLFLSYQSLQHQDGNTQIYLLYPVLVLDELFMNFMA